MVTWILILYFLSGIVSAFATRTDLRPVAYVITIVAWPWFIWNEGTPSMSNFTTKYRRRER